MYVCSPYAYSSHGGKEDIRSLGTGVVDDCELPYGCWELNLCPLQEHGVFSIIEPSLWSPFLVCVCLGEETKGWFQMHCAAEAGLELLISLPSLQSAGL